MAAVSLMTRGELHPSSFNNFYRILLPSFLFHSFCFVFFPLCAWVVIVHVSVCCHPLTKSCGIWGCKVDVWYGLLRCAAHTLYDQAKLSTCCIFSLLWGHLCILLLNLWPKLKFNKPALCFLTSTIVLSVFVCLLVLFGDAVVFFWSRNKLKLIQLPKNLAFCVQPALNVLLMKIGILWWNWLNWKGILGYVTTVCLYFCMKCKDLLCIFASSKPFFFTRMQQAHLLSGVDLAYIIENGQGSPLMRLNLLCAHTRWQVFDLKEELHLAWIVLLCTA